MTPLRANSGSATLEAPDLDTVAEWKAAYAMVAEWKAAYEQVCAERDALSWRLKDCSEVELRGLRAFARAVERHGDPVSRRMASNALLGKYPEEES